MLLLDKWQVFVNINTQKHLKICNGEKGFKISFIIDVFLQCFFIIPGESINNLIHVCLSASLFFLLWFKWCDRHWQKTSSIILCCAFNLLSKLIYSLLLFIVVSRLFSATIRLQVPIIGFCFLRHLKYERISHNHMFLFYPALSLLPFLTLQPTLLNCLPCN